MVANSRVNPNFPIPGIDQSSKGFRDNFSTIKNELEALQGKSIRLTGDVQTAATLIDSGSSDIVLDCTVAINNVAAGGSNLTIQYNQTGVLAGTDTFVYIPSTGRVGIGSSVPAATLDANGSIFAKGSIAVNGSSAANNPFVRIGRTTAGQGNLTISATNASVRFNSVNSNKILMQMNSVNVANFSGTGVSIGPNSSNVAVNSLDVSSNSEDIAKFYSSANYSDNAVRITTDQQYSTAAVILEQRFANYAGGIRIDTDGSIGLHSGENMDAQLSTSSTRLSITPEGRVGIGTSTPARLLDVASGIRTTAYSVADYPNIPISSTGVDVLLDSWPMVKFRSATYTVQTTDTVSGDIDVTTVLVMHANSVAYINETGNVRSAGALLSFDANPNGSDIEFSAYTTNPNLVVKLDSRYITG